MNYLLNLLLMIIVKQEMLLDKLWTLLKKFIIKVTIIIFILSNLLNNDIITLRNLNKRSSSQ